MVRVELARGGDVRFEVSPLLSTAEGGGGGEGGGKGGGQQTARGLCEAAKEVIGAARRQARAAVASSSSSSAAGTPANEGGKGGKGGKADSSSSSSSGGGGGSSAGWRSDELQRKAAVAKGRAEIAKTTASQLRARMDEMERETRRKLLAENPDLREQHTQVGREGGREREGRGKATNHDRCPQITRIHYDLVPYSFLRALPPTLLQMVGDGLIDEEDFWNARRKLLLDEEGRRRGKQTGLPSNILAEIEARAMEGGSEGGKEGGKGGGGGGGGGKTTICLKARDVQFLFELYPALKELYQKKVGREVGRSGGRKGGKEGGREGGRDCF